MIFCIFAERIIYLLYGVSTENLRLSDSANNSGIDAYTRLPMHKKTTRYVNTKNNVPSASFSKHGINLDTLIKIKRNK